jgi:hypothetical protein
MAKLADLWSALSVNEPEKLEEPMVIERLCAEAGLHPSDFLGRLTATAYKHNFDVASYLAAINGAEIVKQRIKQALQPEGFKDAELILKHTNFVREEKGTEINITNQQLNVAKGLPSFQDVVNDVTSIARAEPPAQLPPAIDVPAVVLPQDNSQPAERSRD